MIRFTAKLLQPKKAEGTSPPTWSFLIVPDAASQQLPARGLVSVEGTFNGCTFQTTLQPDGQGGHWLQAERALKKLAKVSVGDMVKIEIAPMAEEPEPRVPPDLRKALAAAPVQTAAVWADITPLARRDWIQWITSGKKAETRNKRIKTACDMLASGKRRPCCFDRSGMYSKNLCRPEAEDE